jgi:hypothetical protein
LPVFVDVALPDFDEAATGAQHRQALGDRLARERVQNDVHALATRRVEHLSSKSSGP